MSATRTVTIICDGCGLNSHPYGGAIIGARRDAERLALVEQQRIANLIALGYGHTSPSGDVVGEARRALVERRSADRHQLRTSLRTRAA